MARTVVWRGLDAARMEIAYVDAAGAHAKSRGTQIGVAYELRYELDGGRLALELVGSQSLEVDLLPGSDFFDLGYSPLFNSLPVWRDGLEEARDYVMTWVSVPELEVLRSEQRYEPLTGGMLRYRAGSFTADIELDGEGIVVRYPGLAELVS
jgi:uncharacterized protein